MKKTQEQFRRMMGRGERRTLNPHGLSRESLDKIYEHLNDGDWENAGYPVTKERVSAAFMESNEDFQCQLWDCKNLAALQELTWAERINKKRNGESRIVFKRHE